MFKNNNNILAPKKQQTVRVEWGSEQDGQTVLVPYNQHNNICVTVLFSMTKFHSRSPINGSSSQHLCLSPITSTIYTIITLYKELIYIIYIGKMSIKLHLEQLLLLTLCLGLVLESNANLNFIFGNTTLFGVNFKSPAWLGRSLSLPAVAGNVRIESDVDPNIQEDSHLNTWGLIHKYGYPAENHTVVTDDGYILTLHRIARPGATPVLLVHGLLDSSATWVMMGPSKGLGYLLYEQGYDVWMANVRGNTYSRGHKKYTHNHAKYWDFSFHEMGIHDIPSTIDYILKKTNYPQLHYIGHSQGTVVFWIMGSERPEYMKKIIYMQALAPVAYLGHCKSPVVNFLAEFHSSVSFILKLIGVHEFLPQNEFIVMFNQLICDETTITKEICSNVIFLTTGFDKSQLNETMLPVVVGHDPAGASTKQMQHFGQLKRSGEFRQFDYGWLRNHWKYNSITPPDYKLENVKAKVALYYGENDWLAQPDDVEALSLNLPNVVSQYLVDYPQFNHLDFIWGVDAKELLYDRMFKNMQAIDDEHFRDNLTA